MDQDQIDKLLAKAKADDRKFKGVTPSAVEEDGKLRVGFEKNIKGKPGELGWARPDPVQKAVDWELDPIKKRSSRERAESMALRLIRSAKNSPAEMDYLMRRVQSDYWQKGIPVTYDHLRRLADELIARAEREAKANDSHSSNSDPKGT